MAAFDSRGSHFSGGKTNGGVDPFSDSASAMPESVRVEAKLAGIALDVLEDSVRNPENFSWKQYSNSEIMLLTRRNSRLFGILDLQELKLQDGLLAETDKFQLLSLKIETRTGEKDFLLVVIMKNSEYINIVPSPDYGLKLSPKGIYMRLQKAAKDSC